MFHCIIFERDEIFDRFILHSSYNVLTKLYTILNCKRILFNNVYILDRLREKFAIKSIAKNWEEFQYYYETKYYSENNHLHFTYEKMLLLEIIEGDTVKIGNLITEIIDNIPKYMLQTFNILNIDDTIVRSKNKKMLQFLIEEEYFTDLYQAIIGNESISPFDTIICSILEYGDIDLFNLSIEYMCPDLVPLNILDALKSGNIEIIVYVINYIIKDQNITDIIEELTIKNFDANIIDVFDILIDRFDDLSNYKIVKACIKSSNEILLNIIKSMNMYNIKIIQDAIFNDNDYYRVQQKNLRKL